MSKYLDKYRNESTRIKNYDYGSNGLYYVTINTHRRTEYFGEIVFVRTGDCPSPKNDTGTFIRTDNRPSLRATEIGNIADEYWQQIPNHYPWVELDEYIIMPNHIHGILRFDKPFDYGWKPNKFGPQSQTLGAVIRAFKSSVKRYANNNKIEFHWHPRFYDHIIRDEQALLNIRNYIHQNPNNWAKENGKE